MPSRGPGREGEQGDERPHPALIVLLLLCIITWNATYSLRSHSFAAPAQADGTEPTTAKFSEEEARAVRDSAIIDRNRAPWVAMESLLPVLPESPLRHLYNGLSASLTLQPSYCPPQARRITDLLGSLGQSSCVRLRYMTQGIELHSLLLRSSTADHGARHLLVYGAGHSEFNVNEKDFEMRLFKSALQQGMDVLITSMPLVGLNLGYAPFSLTTADGPATLDPRLLRSEQRHLVLEAVHTPGTHYLRFFVDSPVLTTIAIAQTYGRASYVGLSGGANTGLLSCALLGHLLQDCILVAGVMPHDIRLVAPATDLGDSEQLSQGFYGRHSVMELLAHLDKIGRSPTLVYNELDPCCFAFASATAFKRKAKKIGLATKFVFTRASEHAFDPEHILRILSEKQKVAGTNEGTSSQMVTRVADGS